MTRYSSAPEVAHIAGDLIATVPDHADLAGVDIIYVWRDKATKSKGRTTLGKARKVSGLNALLARDLEDDSPLFVIEIAEDEWIDLTADEVGLYETWANMLTDEPQDFMATMEASPSATEATS